MTSDQPLVTFAVTTYNQEDVIGRAIASAFAQDYPRLEIIISDDCSTDGTFARAKRLVANYSGPHNVRLNRNETNLYIGGHISRVNRLAKGDLVINAAGDDVSVPHRASRLVEAWLAADRRPGLLHSACYRVEPHQRTLFQNPGQDRLNDIDQAIHCSTYVIGATSAWDRALFASYGDLRPDLTHEDHAMLFRTLRAGRTVAYVDEPLVDHHEGGLTTYGRRPSAEDRRRILSRYLIDAEQKLADLATFPDRSLEVRIRRIADYYAAALAFERGWPRPGDLAKWIGLIGMGKITHLAAKRIVNRTQERRSGSRN